MRLFAVKEVQGAITTAMDKRRKIQVQPDVLHSHLGFTVSLLNFVLREVLGKTSRWWNVVCLVLGQHLLTSSDGSHLEVGRLL